MQSRTLGAVTSTLWDERGTVVPPFQLFIGSHPFQLVQMPLHLDSAESNVSSPVRRKFSMRLHGVLMSARLNLALSRI